MPAVAARTGEAGPRARKKEGKEEGITEGLNEGENEGGQASLPASTWGEGLRDNILPSWDSRQLADALDVQLAWVPHHFNGARGCPTLTQRCWSKLHTLDKDDGESPRRM